MLFSREHSQANVEIGMSSIISPGPKTMKPRTLRKALTAFTILTKKGRTTFLSPRSDEKKKRNKNLSLNSIH